MTTDVHDLLDTFLAVAGADRTQRTRDRYAAVLDLLRAPLPREPSGSPVELLAGRVPAAIGLLERHGGSPELGTALSLCGRLLAWLDLVHDDPAPSAASALQHARATVREAARRRRVPGAASPAPVLTLRRASSRVDATGHVPGAG
ncbi:hypothetical protein [Angustibacter aerolatus]